MLSEAMLGGIAIEAIGIESIGMDLIFIEFMFIEFMFIEFAANPPQAIIADMLSVAMACTATKYGVSFSSGASRCAAAVALPCALTASGGYELTAPTIP